MIGTTKINKGIIALAVTAVICIALGGFIIYGFEKKGTISGTVADEATDMPVFGVTVIATDDEGERYSSRDNTDTTGQDGYFKLELPVGTYTLEYNGESQGYELFESSKKYTVKWNRDIEIDGKVYIKRKDAADKEPEVKPDAASGQSEVQSDATSGKTEVQPDATSGKTEAQPDATSEQPSEVNPGKQSEEKTEGQTGQQSEQQTGQQPGQQSEQQTGQQPEQQTGQQPEQQTGQQTGQQPEQQSEQQTGQQSGQKSEQTTQQSEQQTKEELFTIDSSQIEDYGANMDPYDYYVYYSDNYKEFSFGYPPHLFNRAESSYDDTKSYLGKNIETHTFYGSRGSVLSFSLARREDNLNLTKKIDKLLGQAGVEITDSKNEIQKEAFEDKGFARGVITGFDKKGFVIYTLIKTNSSYVMQMRMECPPYTGDDDRLVKRYVQECIYRWCGFSNKDAGKPRSFKEFREEEEKKK